MKFTIMSKDAYSTTKRKKKENVSVLIQNTKSFKNILKGLKHLIKPMNMKNLLQQLVLYCLAKKR